MNAAEKDYKDLSEVIGYQSVMFYYEPEKRTQTEEMFLTEFKSWNSLTWALLKVATYWFLTGVRAERKRRRTGLRSWGTR